MAYCIYYSGFSAFLECFGHKEQYYDEEHNLLVDQNKISKGGSELLKLRNFLETEQLLENHNWKILLEVYDQYRHENLGRETLAKIFNLSKEDVKLIFQTITRDNPKKRCVVFYGPSNCGKSLLANALCLPFAPGYIQRDSGANVHWLENIYRKSIVLWEEPSIHMTNIDDTKLLLGGEKIVINRKNKHLVERLNGAAVIITTNRSFWEYDRDALLNRINIFNFNVSVSEVTRSYITPGEILDYLLWLVETDD